MGGLWLSVQAVAADEPSRSIMFPATAGDEGGADAATDRAARSPIVVMRWRVNPNLKGKATATFRPVAKYGGGVPALM